MFCILLLVDIFIHVHELLVIMIIKIKSVMRYILVHGRFLMCGI